MSPVQCVVCKRLIPGQPIILVTGQRAIPFCGPNCLTTFADEWAEEVCRLALAQGGHGFVAEYYREMPTLGLLDMPTVN